MHACSVTSVMSDSLQTNGLQPTRLLCPWGFFRQENWSGLPCPPPGDLLDPGIKSGSPVSPLQAVSLPLSHWGIRMSEQLTQNNMHVSQKNYVERKNPTQNSAYIYFPCVQQFRNRQNQLMVMETAGVVALTIGPEWSEALSSKCS